MYVCGFWLGYHFRYSNVFPVWFSYDQSDICFNLQCAKSVHGDEQCTVWWTCCILQIGTSEVKCLAFWFTEKRNVNITYIKKSTSLWVFLRSHVSGKRRRRRSGRTCGGSWKTWSWGEEFRTVTASFPPKHGCSSIPASSSNQCSATGTPHVHAPCATYLTVHSCICLSVFPPPAL